MKDLAVKIALAGVGNLASVFFQGLKYYAGNERRGLWHPKVAGLKPADIQVVAAFDIDQRKVGLELSQAAFAPPNVARRYLALNRTRVVVDPGVSKGDVAPHLKEAKLELGSADGVARRLDETGAELFVNLISSGSSASSEAYARAALRAGCAFINCTPSLLVRKAKLAADYRRAKLPLVGDDLMSQFGGTVFHKGLLSLMVKRGVKVTKSYQLDVGGGSETLNTINEGIKLAKRAIKTTAVASEVPYKFETIAGTTDFVDYMGNDRTSYFWFEGNTFMNSDISVDIYLRSSDGANGSNVLLDVLRATYGSMKAGKARNVDAICAYGFKSPPKPLRYEEAHSEFSAQYVH